MLRSKAHKHVYRPHTTISTLVVCAVCGQPLPKDALARVVRCGAKVAHYAMLTGDEWVACERALAGQKRSVCRFLRASKGAESQIIEILTESGAVGDGVSKIENLKDNGWLLQPAE